MMTPATQEAVVRALRLVEADEKEHGWDRPARVYAVYLMRDAAGLSDAEVREIPLPDVVREAVDRPVDLLAIFARFMEEAGWRVARENGMFGCALMAEAWEVRPSPGQPMEVYERLQAPAERHELYRHPARREVRSVWAMDRERWFYELRRPRRGTHGVTLVPPNEPIVKPVGAVPEALRRIVEAIG